jgi:hypothetical protein
VCRCLHDGDLRSTYDSSSSGRPPLTGLLVGRGVGVAVGFFGGNALIVVELLRPVRPRRRFGTGGMRLHTRHEMARPRLIDR